MFCYLFSLASIFRVFENYFDLPLVVICARIVDIIDKKVKKNGDRLVNLVSLLI